MYVVASVYSVVSVDSGGASVEGFKSFMCLNVNIWRNYLLKDQPRFGEISGVLKV